MQKRNSKKIVIFQIMLAKYLFRLTFILKRKLAKLEEIIKSNKVKLLETEMDLGNEVIKL